jgi:mannosylglycoprotein endo-beta-mannosidase
VARHAGKYAKVSQRLGANVRGEYRRKKKQILAEIQNIDTEGGHNFLNEVQIRRRQNLEVKLEELMEAEEIYWQQKGGEKWILEGDGNTSFFHLVANGRRRKKSILSLNHEGECLTDPDKIQTMIYDFYKKLFGSQPTRRVFLAEGAWLNHGRLTPEENEVLLRPFTLEEMKVTMFEM